MRLEDTHARTHIHKWQELGTYLPQETTIIVQGVKVVWIFLQKTLVHDLGCLVAEKVTQHELGIIANEKLLGNEEILSLGLMRTACG